MNIKTNIPIIIEIPVHEQKELDNLIKAYRKKYIRTSQEIEEKVFLENQLFLTNISKGKVSKSIAELREIVWNEYLKDEVEFNIILM